jgi:phosphatidylglycerol:prolipoprotein diacylglycerol transferase
LFRTILELGPFRVQSYGLMLALGFLVGGILLLRSARKRSLDEGAVLNLIYVIVISAVVGARFMYVATHWGDYSRNPTEIFKIWEGGLTLYGGLLLAVVGAMAYMKRAGLPVLVVCDLAAPSIALGKVLTRVGCFLNGCCFGTEWHSPFGVTFPNSCQAGSVFPGTELHPTQLYSSALSLAVFAALVLLGRRGLKPGAVFWSYLLMDSAVRFGLAFVRYSEPGARAFPVGGITLDYNQVIAVGVAALATAMLLRLRSS